VAILLGIGLLMMLSRAANPVDSPALVVGTLGAMTLTIAVMTITRHEVRALYLAPFTADTNFQVVPQWGNFVVFGLLLAAGLATVAGIVRLVLISPASGADAA
jgi:hypothetical protein